MTISDTPVISEHRLRDVFLLLCGLVLVFSLYPLAGRVLQGEYYGMQVDRSTPAFRLSNPKGDLVSNAHFEGKYLYLMFGYLKCRDVCHSQVLMLSSLAGLIDGDNIAFAFLAMDSNDSASALQAYFDDRGPGFTSLRAASPHDMQQLASAFDANFRFENATDDNYSITHPARIFLVDPRGRLRLIYRGANLEVKRIAADFHQLDMTEPRGV